MTELPPSSDPPPDVLNGARAGDRAAMEALARWCYPRVYRWALVRTGDPDEADDVTQEVVAGLGRRLDGFAARSRFATWLYRVTANEAAGRTRSLARRFALLKRWAGGPAPAPDEERRRLAQLHGEHVTALARTLLNELPERQRVVFDLADLQGFEAGEIAEMLGLDPATVRGHLMRARRAIRSRIVARVPEMVEEGR